MFIIAEEKTQPHAADSGIQAEVVSSWLAPTYQIGRQRPRQVVDNLQKQWARSQLYEWSEGPKGPDLHLQALCSQAQAERSGAIWFLVLDMHLLIRAIHTNRLGPPVPERTDPPDQHTHGPLSFTTRNSGDDGYND
jgi:hypothetical protein